MNPYTEPNKRYQFEPPIEFPSFVPIPLDRGTFSSITQDSPVSVVKSTVVKTPSDYDWAMREAHILSLLSGHPNIVALRGTSTVDDGHTRRVDLSLEYVRGQTLHDWVVDYEDDPARRRATWLPMAQTLVSTVQHMHQQGIVHLDLHAKNVMVNPDNHCLKLIDFGRSCDRGFAATDGHPCKAMGNFDYKPPRPANTADPWADLLKDEAYVVGSLLFTWFFGYPPYHEYIDGRRQLVLDLKLQLEGDVVASLPYELLLFDPRTKMEEIAIDVMAALLDRDPLARSFVTDIDRFHDEEWSCPAQRLY